MPVQVAVCGPGECTDLEAAQAYEVGELLAVRGAVVICGGGAGVMAAAAAGAQVRGGLTVGILPAGTHDGVSTDLSVTIATGMGEARNSIIAASADAVIVIGGSWGTLSELALAKRRGDVPVVALGGWRILDADRREVGGIRYVASPADAVAAALTP